jgi:hypothetical protein
MSKSDSEELVIDLVQLSYMCDVQKDGEGFILGLSR